MPSCGRAYDDNIVERDLRPFVGPVSKGRFRTLPVCILKLSNFESMYSGNATEAFAWAISISPTPEFLYIYNKVYPLEVGISAYMYVWDVQAVVCMYIITRRGQALRCLSLSRGNARA